MTDITLGKDFYETVRIKDSNGNVLSEFSFNPSDSNIVERYEEFKNMFPEIEKRINEYESVNQPNGNYEKVKGILSQADAVIYEQFNKLLNADVAKDIFSVMGPLSPTPYGYYMTFILENILEAINKATGAKLKKMESKVAKYTAKYHG